MPFVALLKMPRNLPDSDTTPVVTKKQSRNKSSSSVPVNHDDSENLSREGKLIYQLLSKKLEEILEKLELKVEKIENLERENYNLRRDMRKLEEE